MKNRFFFWGIGVVFFMISSIVGTRVDRLSEASGPVNEQEVRLFIDEYVKRFARMDLEPYMALFSLRAVENRALPYADIREAYRKTIQISHSIQYEADILTIQPHLEGTLVSGRYRLTQAFKGRGVRRIEGNIQWLLIREDGTLKIREINYGIDR
jgi:hypothetical protein